MLGLTPKSAFLDFLRAATMGSGDVSPATIKRNTTHCREAIFHRFGDRLSTSRSQRRPSATYETAVRVTRPSSLGNGEDWVVDMDAAECKITNIWRLDRYFMEHIFSLKEKTNLLLLVSINNGGTLLKGTGAAVHKQQQNKIILLDGRRYYQLHFGALSDTKDNALVTGGRTSQMYTQKMFEDDVSGGHRGFQMKYKGIDLANPLSIMFFGPPLSSSGSFDSIFKDVKSTNTLHHKCMCYYSPFLETPMLACPFPTPT